MQSYLPSKRQVYTSTLILFILSVGLYFMAAIMALSAWENTTTVFQDVMIWIGSYIIYPSILLVSPLIGFIPKILVIAFAAFLNSLVFSSLFLALFNFIKSNKKVV